MEAWDRTWGAASPAHISIDLHSITASIIASSSITIVFSIAGSLSSRSQGTAAGDGGMYGRRGAGTGAEFGSAAIDGMIVPAAQRRYSMSECLSTIVPAFA